MSNTTTIALNAESMKGLPPMLDADQAAEILNVHPRTVARMCINGELKAVKVRSLWRINRDALLEFAGLE